MNDSVSNDAPRYTSTVNEDQAAAARFSQRATFLAAMVGNASTDSQARALATLGLSIKAYGLLTLLRQRGAETQNELSRTLNASPSTVVATVDTLEKAGYVIRRGDPNDRRRNAIDITDSGRAIARQADALSDEVETDFLTPLSPKEQQTLRTLLSRLWPGT